MPKINVYLSDELAEAVKAAGLPVSPICQRALEAAVRRVSTIREVTDKMDLRDLESADMELTRFTAKARTALVNAARIAGEAGAATVRTEHLLLGILGEGTNMAVEVLRSMEIEPDDVHEDLAEKVGGDGRPAEGRQFDPTTANAMKNALSEAISMAHNYVGCEHLLLGLIAEPDGAAGVALRSRGAELRLTRKAVAATLAGFVYAQSQLKSAAGNGDAARQALAQIGQRLDRLEAAVAKLTGDQGD